MQGEEVAVSLMGDGRQREPESCVVQTHPGELQSTHAVRDWVGPGVNRTSGSRETCKLPSFHSALGGIP